MFLKCELKRVFTIYIHTRAFMRLYIVTLQMTHDHQIPSRSPVNIEVKMLNTNHTYLQYNFSYFVVSSQPLSKYHRHNKVMY